MTKSKRAAKLDLILNCDQIDTAAFVVVHLDRIFNNGLPLDSKMMDISTTQRVIQACWGYFPVNGQYVKTRVFVPYFLEVFK